MRTSSHVLLQYSSLASLNSSREWGLPDRPRKSMVKKNPEKACKMYYHYAISLKRCNRNVLYSFPIKPLLAIRRTPEKSDFPTMHICILVWGTINLNFSTILDYHDACACIGQKQYYFNLSTKLVQLQSHLEGRSVWLSRYFI